MSEPTYLLDTSALLLFLKDGEGAERVETLLRYEQVFVPFVALLEAHAASFQERSEDVADRRYGLLKQLPVTFLHEVDEPVLLTASRFQVHNRLSMTDAIVAAFALRRGAILVHKDPAFAALKEDVPQEALP